MPKTIPGPLSSETLAALLLADAIVWFIVVRGWGQFLLMPTPAAGGRRGTPPLDVCPASWHNVNTGQERIATREARL